MFLIGLYYHFSVINLIDSILKITFKDSSGDD